MHHIPCRDLFQAYGLRSWLLAHDIEAEVIHEYAGGLYFPNIFPPQVAIADEDVERFKEVAAQPEPPLDDTFVPPAEEVSENAGKPEDPTPREESPSPLGWVAFGAVFGAASGLLIAILVTINAAFDKTLRHDGLHRAAERGLELLPLVGGMAGAIGGLILWPVIRFARSCRVSPQGQIPERGRWVTWLLVILCTPLIGVLLWLWDRLRVEFGLYLRIF